MINLLLPFQEPIRLIHSFFILCGIWVIGKYARMVYYEMFYYRDAGMDYLKNGKKYVIEKFHRK